MKILMRQTAQFIAGIIGAITLANELFPGFLFTLHGIKDIPPGGIASFRIFSLYLLPYAFANFFLLFLVTRKDVEYTTKITVISNIFQPLVGLLIMKVCSAPWVYLSYSITAVLLLIPYMLCYRFLSEQEKREAENCRDTVLYMSVKPHEAVEASRAIREFADEQKIHKKSRTGLHCVWKKWLLMWNMSTKKILPPRSSTGGIRLNTRYDLQRRY
ncbi:MAG: hypothetical protein K5760_01690 [Clostridium sp.]|nr:hypothetical protein [Clostridium sp.]